MVSSATTGSLPTGKTLFNETILPARIKLSMIEESKKTIIQTRECPGGRCCTMVKHPKSLLIISVPFGHG